MREIKFDYLTRQPNTDIYYHNIYTLDELWTGIGKAFPHGVNPQNVVAKREYTGLKDKNGVEIYEGDVFTSSKETGSVQGVVEFLDGAFVASNPAIETPPNLGDVISMTSVEVVGNIYENPDLLTS